MKKTFYSRKVKCNPQKSRHVPGLFMTCLKEENTCKSLGKKVREGLVQYIQTLQTEISVHDTLPHRGFLAVYEDDLTLRLDTFKPQHITPQARLGYGREFLYFSSSSWGEEVWRWSWKKRKPNDIWEQPVWNKLVLQLAAVQEQHEFQKPKQVFIAFVSLLTFPDRIQCQSFVRYPQDFPQSFASQDIFPLSDSGLPGPSSNLLGLWRGLCLRGPVWGWGLLCSVPRECTALPALPLPEWQQQLGFTPSMSHPLEP